LRTFGPEREEDGSRIKLSNDELHDLYSSPNIVRVIKSRRLGGRDMLHAGGRGKVLSGFWLGSPPGKPESRWEENIKMGVG
jgi:hypothetical protein